MAVNCYYYHQCQKRTPITNMVANRTRYQNINKRRSKEVRVIECHKISEVKKHPLKIIVSQDLELDNILKIFLKFTNFEPHYSYKKSVYF